MHQSKRVLVVDDDPGIVEVIELVLTDEGYEVESTSNGATFGHALRFQPHVILLDMMMDGMDGVAVSRQLRADPRTQNIPIITISAGGSIQQYAAAMNAQAYLEKPFDIDEMLAKVAHYA